MHLALSLSNAFREPSVTLSAEPTSGDARLGPAPRTA
jgi:hypothetical protein